MAIDSRSIMCTTSDMQTSRDDDNSSSVNITMSMTSTERDVMVIWAEADDVDEALSPTLVPSADSFDAVERKGSLVGAEEIIETIDGLKSPPVAVNCKCSAVTQEALEPNIFDPASDATHNGEETKEEVRMWEKTTEDIDDTWTEVDKVVEQLYPLVILTDASTEGGVQMDVKKEADAVTGSEEGALVLNMMSTYSNDRAKGMNILMESKEEVENIWAEADEVVEPIRIAPIMLDKSTDSVVEAVVLINVKVTEAVVGSNKNRVKEEVNMWVETEEVENIWAEADKILEPISPPCVRTDESMGSVDDVKVMGSNENAVKEEVNTFVGTKEEVEDIWDEAEEVVKPQSPSPVITEKSMGSVNQMNARNVTEANAGVDDPQQIRGTDTADVKNVWAEVVTVEETVNTEKLSKGQDSLNADTISSMSVLADNGKVTDNLMRMKSTRPLSKSLSTCSAHVTDAHILADVEKLTVETGDEVTHVQNFLTPRVEVATPRDKLSPRMEEFVEIILREGSSCVHELSKNGVELIKVSGNKRQKVECEVNKDQKASGTHNFSSPCLCKNCTLVQDLQESKEEQSLVEQVNPASHEEETRDDIAVRTQHLSCHTKQLHADDGAQTILKIRTDEEVDEKASSGGKPTVQMMCQEELCKSSDATTMGQLLSPTQTKKELPAKNITSPANNYKLVKDLKQVVFSYEER